MIIFKNKKPIKTVFLFSLAPALVACSFFLIGLVEQIIKNGLNLEFLFYLIILPLMILYSMFIFGIPSTLLGIIYVLLNLYKSWISYIFIFFVGGASAVLWADFIFNSIEYDLSASPGVSAFYIFIQGAFSSLIISFFALPRKVS